MSWVKRRMTFSKKSGGMKFFSFSPTAFIVSSSSALNKLELKGEERGGGCPSATRFLSSFVCWDQTSWSSRSWKVSRPQQAFLRASSEPSWAARRNSFRSSVTEPRDKASCSSATLTALCLSWGSMKAVTLSSTTCLMKRTPNLTS